MADFPIIFSAPMVRALLDGRKTMTRRLVPYGSSWMRVLPGDRLWVRESLTHVTSDPVTGQSCSVHCYTASIPDGMSSANPYEPNYLFANDGEPTLKPKNIPSIHMPRWCSRLTLTVIAVRIERLQDITETDAMAEGVQRAAAGTMDANVGQVTIYKFRTGFVRLWGELHGTESWLANPEVVAITFRVVRANIDEPEERAA